MVLYSCCGILLKIAFLQDSSDSMLVCPLIPYFELGSVHQDSYLVNTNISVKLKRDISQDVGLYVKEATARVR